MENEKIICNECSTENEKKYEYCKNCGAKLNRSETQTENNQTNANFSPNTNGNFDGTYNQTNNNYNYAENPQQDFACGGTTYVESIDGIPYGDVVTFVGKQANKYMPVFSRLEVVGSKTAWHWPTALLCFFFGPLGASLWYFYRKMYKHAAILAGIGTLLTVISTLALNPTAMSETLLETFFAYLKGEVVWQNLFFDKSMITYEIVTVISGLIELVLTIICGLFTHYWYKGHICKTIAKYRASNLDMRYYQMGLMSLGGTSGGMLALGFGIMFFVENILTTIITLISAALAVIGG